MNFKEATKKLSECFETMHTIVNSFSEDELQQIMKKNNYNLKVKHFKYIVFDLMYCLIWELLEIKETEFFNSVKND